MRKIAQVCPRYFPYIGGVETHVKEISERLVRRGYEVEVLTTDPKGKLPKEEVINGVIVKRFNSWAPNEAYYFSRDLKRYLIRNSKNYNIIHAHNYHALPALYAAQVKNNRNRLVFTPHFHGEGHTFFRSLLHILYKHLAKRIFEKADWIICCSNYEKGLIIKKFKINVEKVKVIPNGVNLKEFKHLKKEKESGSKTILYVGRIEKYKGIHYLIRALPMLNEDIRLEVIGEGPYKRTLLKLVNKLGVKSRVCFYQNLSREKLLQKYAMADLFVLLSKYEAFSISVAEALSLGTPCIVANTSALREWIDNESCFGIDYPVNIEKLVTMINEVIKKKPKSVIPRLLTWEEVTEKIAQLYENL